MLTVLAIDTASDPCSVALLRGGHLIECALDEDGAPGDRVLEEVDRLLATAGLQPASCDGFAFGAGPGGFTGLRIACGVVQGFAWATGRPVVPVGSLRALAAASGHAGERVLAAIDARLGEIYWSVLDSQAQGADADADGCDWIERTSAALARSGELSTLCREHAPQVLALGPGLAAPTGTPVRLVRQAVRAGTIARIAARALARGEGVAARDAAPFYVRDRVALTVAERRGQPVATSR